MNRRTTIACDCGLVTNVRVWPLNCACGRRYLSPDAPAVPLSAAPARDLQNDDNWVSPHLCARRGDALRTEVCRVCGPDRGKTVDVFRCEHFGQCTIRRYKVGQKEAVCLGCQQFIRRDKEGEQMKRRQRRRQRQEERKRKLQLIGEAHYDPLKWFRYYDRELRPAHLSDLWRGSAGFLVAGGPSAKDIDFSFLRERGVISLAINNVAAHAPVKAMVCSDPPEKFHHAIWLDPGLMKLVPSNKLNKFIRLKRPDGTFEQPRIRVKECPNVFAFARDCDYVPEDFLLRDTATWGRNKQAMKSRPGKDKLLFTFFLGIRLMWALGCDRIYLIGADFGMRPGGAGEGYAFAQRRDQGAVDANHNSYRVAAKWLQELRPVFENAGLHVFQTNAESNLRVFDHVPLAHAIEDARGIAGNDPLDLAGWYEKPGQGGDIQETP